MTARVPCCVPFCRRTTGKLYAEWICGEHWRLVPRKLKSFGRRAAAANRRAKIACEALEDMSDERYPDVMLARFKAAKRTGRAWERCKRAAIEAAAGIA